MEPWRQVFREGIAPQLPVAALEALRLGLLKNDPRLRPGSTVEESWTVAGIRIIQGCAIGYGAWKGIHLDSARDVERFFSEICSAANDALGDPGAVGHFISWFDNHRREFVFPLLLSEVNRAIAYRVTQETDEGLLDDYDEADDDPSATDSTPLLNDE
jgi:hypothetical protein